MRYSITPSLHHSITPSLHHSITPSLHHSITPSLHHSTTPSLHHSITPSLHHSITPSLHYSITPLLHHSAAPHSLNRLQVYRERESSATTTQEPVLPTSNIHRLAPPPIRTPACLPRSSAARGRAKSRLDRPAALRKRPAERRRPSPAGAACLEDACVSGSSVPWT